MKSINQINSFVERNETINLYKWLSSDEGRYSGNWRNNYYKFFRGNKTSDSLTITGNFTYGAACSELNRYISKEQLNWDAQFKRDYRTQNLEYEAQGSKIEFYIAVEQGMNGVYLYIRGTNFRPFNTCEQMSKRYKIRSNKSLSELDIKEYFDKKILPKILFAPGLFRKIQIVRNCDKKAAIEFYKEYISFSRVVNTEFDEVDTNKTLRQRVCKKLNILVECDKTDRELIKLLNTTERQKTRKKLFCFPSVWELSEMYANEYDDDEHLEGFVNEIENDYPKNAIFI